MTPRPSSAEFRIHLPASTFFFDTAGRDVSATRSEAEPRPGGATKTERLRPPERGGWGLAPVTDSPVAVDRTIERGVDVRDTYEERGYDAADETRAGGTNGGDGFRWRPALKQSMLFLAVQHGYAMTQPKTRRDLKGEFFRDYLDSVKSLHGWSDGGRFFTNYVAHPMQGSFVGFIYVQNDPKAMRQKFGTSGDYWKSRMKAMAWSAAWSTQFEIGPLSQASIGNVGSHGKQTYVDLVVTPTVGTGMLITEDALDRYVVERIERRFENFYARAGARLLLNPTRSVANLIRFKKPWHRDRPRAR